MRLCFARPLKKEMIRSQCSVSTICLPKSHRLQTQIQGLQNHLQPLHEQTTFLTLKTNTSSQIRKIRSLYNNSPRQPHKNHLLRRTIALGTSTVENGHHRQRTGLGDYVMPTYAGRGQMQADSQEIHTETRNVSGRIKTHRETGSIIFSFNSRSNYL